MDVEFIKDSNYGIIESRDSNCGIKVLLDSWDINKVYKYVKVKDRYIFGYVFDLRIFRYFSKYIFGYVLDLRIFRNFGYRLKVR